MVDERSVERRRAARTPRRRSSSRRRRSPGRPRRARGARAVSTGRSSGALSMLVVEAQHRGRRAALQRPAGMRRARRRTMRTPKAAVRVRGGAGAARRRAPVITPSVPSLPTNTWLRSGPAAARGALPCGRRCRRRARRRGRAPCPRSSRSGSRAGPALRHASQPPTVESSIDCGQCPSVTRCVVAQLVLEHVAERPGVHVDHQRRGRRRRRCRRARRDRARRRRAAACSRPTRRCARPPP